MDAATPSPKLPAQAPPALTIEQLATFQKAERRAAKIRRAANVARTDGGITAFFAVCCLLSFCMGWENIVLGIIFTGVAINAFRGAKRLQKFDPDAATILMLNQVYLAGAIILYALYELHAAMVGGSGSFKELEALGSMGQDYANMERTVAYALYGVLIVGTIVGQGAMGLYYVTRRRLVEEYVKETPQWVMDLQKVQVR
jgi:hypothetical protein